MKYFSSLIFVFVFGVFGYGQSFNDVEVEGVYYTDRGVEVIRVEKVNVDGGNQYNVYFNFNGLDDNLETEVKWVYIKTTNGKNKKVEKDILLMIEDIPNKRKLTSSERIGALYSDKEKTKNKLKEKNIEFGR